MNDLRARRVGPLQVQEHGLVGHVGPIISSCTLNAIVGGGQQEEDVTAVGGTFDVIVGGQEENVMSFNGGAWWLRLQPNRRALRRDFLRPRRTPSPRAEGRQFHNSPRCPQTLSLPADSTI